MNNYVISEEELRKLVSLQCNINLWLKDKQPIEMIASGEIFYKGKKAWIKNPEYDSKDEAIFRKFNGKSIKIYVEEIK